MIRAIAIASESSDLVGTVDLACTREGLALTFVRAAPYAVSFAPTVPVVGRRAVVPYDRIERVWDDGETLRIVMDAPRIPYKRLVLAHFTHDRRVDHRSLAEQRRKRQLIAAGSAAVAAAILVPLASRISPFLGSFLGAGTVFGIVAGALLWAPELTRGVLPEPNQSGMDRRALFEELRAHLPLDAWEDFAPAPITSGTSAPGPVRGRSVPPVAVAAGVLGGPAAPGALVTRSSAEALADRERDEDTFAWPLPGRTMALSLGAALVGLLALSTSLRMLRPPETAPTGSPQNPNNSAAIAVSNDTIRPDQTPKVEAPPGESCLCQTPTSIAIPVRVPRITKIAAITRQRGDAQRPSLDLELAVVNNAAEPTGEIKANIEFLHPLAPGATPAHTQNRGVFYEGPLAGGAAIKWRVRGRGSSFTVDGLDESALDDGSLASPDAFAKLLDAHTRAVRLHGAAMLARARDERAGPAIERLRAEARDDEAAFLGSIARAAAPIYACKLGMEAQSDGQVAVSACVMNTTNDDAGPLEVSLALSPGGTRGPVGGRRGGKPDETSEAGAVVVRAALAPTLRVPAKTGVVVHGTIDVSAVQGEVVGEVEVGPATAERTHTP
jgi:hypothetical protein